MFCVRTFLAVSIFFLHPSHSPSFIQVEATNRLARFMYPTRIRNNHRSLLFLPQIEFKTIGNMVLTRQTLNW